MKHETFEEETSALAESVRAWQAQAPDNRVALVILAHEDKKEDGDGTHSCVTAQGSRLTLANALNAAFRDSRGLLETAVVALMALNPKNKADGEGGEAEEETTDNR